MPSQASQRVFDCGCGRKVARAACVVSVQSSDNGSDGHCYLQDGLGGGKGEQDADAPDRMGGVAVSLGQLSGDPG